MSLSRRALLETPLAAVTPGLAQPAAGAGRRIRLAVSTYSYWHFRGEKYPIEKAARLGFDGVEILHRQMASETPDYVNGLKRLAFVNGLDLVMLSIHQGFIFPDAGLRRRNVEHTRQAIALAARRLIWL